jgi:gamma-glutamyltranspeptidase/glutathione hydrolase
VGDLGGKLSLDDLRKHETTFEEAIKVTYRGVDVYEVPPNGQGITALIALNMLNQIDPTNFGERGSADHMHYMIEACRLAFADTRWFVADPAKHPVPVTELLSEEYAKERLAKIDPKVASAEVLKGSPLASCDTVSFQVVDGEGNAVSFVNSNYEGFGSGIIPQGKLALS